MKSILLVDDERWVRIALKKTIEKTRLPFQVVHEAANGQEAMQWLNEHHADLVMTDIRMPMMDGISMMRELLESRGKLPGIIVVSGYDDFLYAQHAMRLGAFDYLLKSVEVEDMQLCLERWLQTEHRIAERGNSNENIPELAWEELSPVEQVMKVVELAMPGDISLKDAASKVHLNPNYLSQLFKQKTGSNFIDYVTGVRMREAEKLLSSTHLRIYEVAEQLGFCDISYFSNLFKKHSGLSPSEYRKVQPEQSDRDHIVQRRAEYAAWSTKPVVSEND